MPEYIDAEVTTLRDSTSDDELTLVLRVTGDRDESASRVEKIRAAVETTLGQATLRVATPESAIDRLCELVGLKSIESERGDLRAHD